MIVLVTSRRRPTWQRFLGECAAVFVVLVILQAIGVA